MSVHIQIGRFPIGVDKNCRQWGAEVSNVTKGSLMHG